MRFSSLFRFGLGKGCESASDSGARPINESSLPLILTQNSSGMVSSIFGDPKTIGDFQHREFQERAFVDRVHLLDRVDYLQALDNACSHGQSASVDIRFRSKGNDNSVWTWLACHVSPFRVEDNAAVLARVRYENIARVKHAETDFLKVRDELERAQAEHARLLSQIGHQLGNSLQAILGNAEILALETTTQCRRLDNIIDAAQELKFLADEVRQTGPASRSIDVTGNDEFQWSELIDDIMESAVRAAKARHVEIEIEVSPSLPNSNIDKPSTRLVLASLIKELTGVAPKDSKISIAARQYGPKVKFEFEHSSGADIANVIDENLFLQNALKRLGGSLSTAVVIQGQQITVMLPIKSNSSSQVGGAPKRRSQTSVDNKGEYRARLSA